MTTSDGVHYGAEDVRRVKRKYNHVRSELQKKGTRSAKRRLVSISGCEKRFVHDQNHCISKKLANTDENVSVYVLEDLSSMNMLRLKGKSNKTMRKWLSGWSYSDLEEKLTYKCKRNGIRVEFVDARYTSQKCSVCKTIDKASRKGNRYICRHCGSRMHADTNAAINIRDNYITRVLKVVDDYKGSASHVWYNLQHAETGNSADFLPYRQFQNLFIQDLRQCCHRMP